MKHFPTIGFIGTGEIASALVTGICSHTDMPHPVIISPRNAARAAALKDAFPEQVTIAIDNQEVIDKADWVILAIVPHIGEQILKKLHFRPEHKVINLLSDKSLDQIRAWIGPTEVLIHMVPLPFAARRIGPIAIYPPQSEVERIFAPLGQIVSVETAREIHVLAAITALMAPYYTLLHELVTWCGSYGVDELSAKAYTTSLFSAMNQLADDAEEGRLARMAEIMTPGGLNYMAKQYLLTKNAFNPWAEALDPVMDRLEGKT
jgi:pyrroline-5-carboxylate reductase